MPLNVLLWNQKIIILIWYKTEKFICERQKPAFSAIFHEQYLIYLSSSISSISHLFLIVFPLLINGDDQWWTLHMSFPLLKEHGSITCIVSCKPICLVNNSSKGHQQGFLTWLIKLLFELESVDLLQIIQKQRHTESGYNEIHSLQRNTPYRTYDYTSIVVTIRQ